MNNPVFHRKWGEIDARPWLASLLMQRGNRLSRFVHYYDQLARRPRAWRRQLRRKLAVTVTGAAILLALAGFVVQAETDNVINVVNGEVRAVDNGKCSLVEAIRNANNQNSGQVHNDCAAGNPAGADTIVLPANSFFTLTMADNSGDFGPNGLPWLTSKITFDGNGATIQRDSGAPSFRILAVGPKGNVTLDSMTIRGGYASIAPYGYYGAGILNQGQLVIQSSRVIENVLYAEDIGASGGGIFSEGSLNIVDSIVSDNEIVAYLSARGGGIRSTGDLEISNSTISGNLAGGSFGYGGGIFSDGNLVMEDVVLTGNRAGGYAGEGGGLRNTGMAIIAKSLFVNNSADGFAESSTYGPYFGFGGGIDNTGTLTLANVTVSNNSVEYGRGGGISNRGRSTIISSTISNNSNDGLLAGCRIAQSAVKSTTQLLRTIVSGNDRSEIAANAYVYRDEYCNPEFQANAFNVIGFSGNANSPGFTPAGTDIVPAVSLSALLYPIANNGGPTQTHGLPAGSPAIDRAPNDACMAAPVSGVDQRGLPRNRNGAGGNSDNECDIGAFEFQPVEATPTATSSATAPPPTSTPPPTGYPPSTSTPTVTPTRPVNDYSSFIPIMIREFRDALTD